MDAQKRVIISDSGDAIRLNPQVVRKMISEHIRVSVSPRLKDLEEDENGINEGDNQIHGNYIEFSVAVDALAKLIELYERTKGEGEEVDIRLSSDNI